MAAAAAHTAATPAAAPLPLSRSWVVTRRQGASYTGGPLSLLADGVTVASACSERVALLRLDTGIVTAIIPADGTTASAASGPVDAAGESITAFAASPTSPALFTAGRNGMLRLWRVDGGGGAPPAIVRSWRSAHRLPVVVADFERTGTLVATGGADKLVMVYDVDGGNATHSFRGHGAVISAVRFAPHPHSVERLISASEDGGLRVWDLITSTCLAAAAEHFGAVTTLLFSPDPHGYTMVTGGRDKMLAVWNMRALDDLAAAATLRAEPGDDDDDVAATLRRRGGGGGGRRGKAALAAAAAAPGPSPFKAALTMPALEGIEAGVVLPAPDAARAAREVTFLVAGDRGQVRRWRLDVDAAVGAPAGPPAWRYHLACATGTTVARMRRGEAAVDASSAGLLAGAVTARGTGSASSAVVAGAEEAPVSHQIAVMLLVPPAPTAASAPVVAPAPTAAGTADVVGGKRKRGAESASTALAFGDARVAGAGAAPPALLVATRDHVLTLLRSADLVPSKTIVGYNDEILDLRYIPPCPYSTGPTPLAATAAAAGTRNLVALATNSEQLRLVNLDTFDARLCDGHSDLILGLAVSPDGALVATASKDKTVRVWDVETGVTLAVAEGHMESVAAVAWPVRPTTFCRAGNAAPAAATAAASAATVCGWLISAGKDRTVKVWNAAPLLGQLASPRPSDGTWTAAAAAALSRRAGAALRTLGGVVAHDKEVNALAVAPNDRLLATASQDKTVKLWLLPDLKPLATLRGHRRGVWAVAFSPADQVLASASGDRTVRLWSASPAAGFACLQTLEGHDASVLSVRFLRRGAQVLSCGADGLVKLWNARTAECANTFDAHTQKVWTLAVRPTSGADEAETEFVTGGADSLLNVWRDVTSDEVEGEQLAREAALAKQQSLYSAMASRDYIAAVSLTLELDQPYRCGEILAELLDFGPKPRSLGVPATVVDALYRSEMLSELAEMSEEAEGGSAAAGAGVGASKDPAAAALRGFRAAKMAAAGVAPPLVPGSTLAQREGERQLLHVLAAMTPVQLGRLLLYIRDWNTQSRHGLLAHRLLQVILRHVRRQRVMQSLVEARSQAALVSVLAGVGSTVVAKRAGALSNAFAEGLAPVVGGVVPETAETAGAAAAAPTSSRTAAAAELQAFVAAMVPYAERHAERLDRLLVSSHLVDMVLGALRGMPAQRAFRDELEGGAAAADAAGRAALKASLMREVKGGAVAAAAAGGWSHLDDDASSSDDDSDGDVMMTGVRV